MKKIISAFLLIALCLSLLASCGGTTPLPGGSEDENKTETEKTADTDETKKTDEKNLDLSA